MVRTGAGIVEQRDQPAHDEEHLAVHVARGVGGEVDHPRRDVLRPGVLELERALPPGALRPALLTRRARGVGHGSASCACWPRGRWR